MKCERIDYLSLPNPTHGRFALLLQIALSIAFSSGVDLVRLYKSPAAIGNADLAAAGILASGLLLIFSFIHYFAHPLVQARAFGPSRPIDSNSETAGRIVALSKLLNVTAPKVLVDFDIRNFDALAFGLANKKTILLGRGLLLLHALRPEEFDARIAHELGHIRNRDVGVAFFARALVQLTLILPATAIALWVARSVLGVATGWHQWSASEWTLLEFVHSYESWFGVHAMLGAGMIFAVLFWAAILLAQHNAFLRTRELYADNVSASFLGQSGILNAIGSIPSRAPGFFDKLLSIIFSSHPPVDLRRRTAEVPSYLDKPTVGRIASLGYLCGVVLSSVFLIRPNLFDLPGFQGVVSLSEFMSPNNHLNLITNLAIYGAGVFLFPIYFIAVLFLMRVSSWAIVAAFDPLRALGLVGMAAATLGLSFLGGLMLNPVNLRRFFSGDFSAFALDRTEVSFSITLVGCCAVGLIAIGPIMRRLLTSSRQSQPPMLTWLSIGILCLLFIGESFTAWLAAFDPIVAARGDTLSLVVVLLGEVLFFWLMAYVVARRSFSPCFMPAQKLAAWVLLPAFTAVDFDGPSAKSK